MFWAFFAERGNKNNMSEQNEKYLSLIVEIDNRKSLKKLITNVKSEVAGYSCEMLVVGKVSAKTDALLREQNTEDFSIRVIKQTGNTAKDLNTALDLAEGEIIHITRSTCEYGNGSIREAFKQLSSDDISSVSLTPYYVTVKGGETRIRQFKVGDQKYPVRIDLATDNEDSWSRYLFTFFMKRQLAEDLRFSEDLEYEYRREFLAELYARQPVYYLLEQKLISHEYPDVDMYNYHPMYNYDWYTDELKTLARELLDIDDPNRINQRILMDFISMQFSANEGDRSKSILIGKDLDDYFDSISEILQGIDDDIISVLQSGQHRRIPFPMYYLFIEKKHGTGSVIVHPEISAKDYQFGDGYIGTLYDFVSDEGVILAKSDRLYAGIRAVNLVGRELVFDVELNNTYFDDAGAFDISVISSKGEVIDIRRTDIYSLKKMFGISVFKRMTFQFSLPLTENSPVRYHMSVKYKGIEIIPRLSFNKPQSRIKSNQEHNFWNVSDNTLKYDRSQREIVLMKRNGFRTLRNEIGYWSDIFSKNSDKKRALAFVALRAAYYITKPYYSRKNIWLTFDQLFKGGDNGEYFFRYVNDLKNDHQILYYVINEDTHEYRELSKKYKTVLKFSSFKHKLCSLHTNIIFTTRADATLYAGFAKTAEIFFRNLFNFDVVCLQHGLSIQQIAQYQNRVFDNLKYYFCVSKYEIDNLSRPVYGFEDKSMLALTGAPRYDGLVGKPKKQIIISPTWRRNVTSGTNKKGSNHEYSSNFKSTHYYQIYNGLINDERLLDCAKETGYKLIYLIHPILSPQIDDFDKNDYVQILPGTEVNYEKILVDSALMLTDHSGIMYDFAYQRKPLIYYHPEELPPQYSEGGLNYETMGFGPVCRTREQVVEELCRAMRSDCRLEEKYKERIEDFFEFDDQRNCERVYKAALEFEKRQGK